MALDPTISLGIKPPQIENPIDAVTKAVTLRDMMQQAALRTQQIIASQQAVQNEQLAFQQKQKDLQDESLISKLHYDPNFQKAYASGDFQTLNSMLGGVQEKYRQGVINTSQDLLTKANANTDADLKHLGEFHAAAANLLASANPESTDDQEIPRFKAGLASLRRDYPKFAAQVPDGSAITPDNYGSAIKNAGAALNITNLMLENQAKVREAQEKAKTAGQTKLASGESLYANQDLTPGANPQPIVTAPIRSEGEIQLTPQQKAQFNAATTQRWQVNHPGQTPPNAFMLGDNATQKDYDRVHQALQGLEQAEATKAQNATSNSLRAGMQDIARQGLELRQGVQNAKPVIATDNSGREVFTNYGDAVARGYKNINDSPGQTEQNKVNSARAWTMLASKVGRNPDEMGILQQINYLDKKGALGPAAGRWNEFMAGKVGAGDLVKGFKSMSPEEQDRIRDAFEGLRVNLELGNSLLMNVHVGQRGGLTMLENFKKLADQSKMSGDLLRSGIKTELNYAKDRAMAPPDMSLTPGHASFMSKDGKHTIATNDGGRTWFDAETGKDIQPK